MLGACQLSIPPQILIPNSKFAIGKGKRSDIEEVGVFQNLDLEDPMCLKSFADFDHSTHTIVQSMKCIV